VFEGKRYTSDSPLPDYTLNQRDGTSDDELPTTEENLDFSGQTRDFSRAAKLVDLGIESKRKRKQPLLLKLDQPSSLMIRSQNAVTSPSHLADPKDVQTVQ